MLLNEVLTNTFKHAFPDERSGTVRISLRNLGDAVELVVTDDGIGMRGPRRRRRSGSSSCACSQISCERRSRSRRTRARPCGYGVRPGGDYKVGGNGMAITRNYKDLGGNVIDPAKGDLKLGDLVFVEIEVSNTSGAGIQNIALVEWVKDAELWATDFMNLRDDRLEAFGTLSARTAKKIIYTVHAVTSGKFTIPPVEAEAMYDATLWAREKGGTASSAAVHRERCEPPGRGRRSPLHPCPVCLRKLWSAIKFDPAAREAALAKTLRERGITDEAAGSERRAAWIRGEPR